ncbi:MAG TPA: chemotaxis response regulator protein-glutamate methylesterase [Acidobacteriota bacterium]|nr:chemotaxis response regulator protein-glutamate methylesterase [Acidobacteriota bacterium]
MRIALVNDLPIAVEALRRIIAAQPEHEIAWIAWDGAEAVEKCAADTPDLVLMDLIMPVMDGVEATRRIMRDSPCAVLVVTATVSGNSSKVFEAMGHGALDAVNTPVFGVGSMADGADALLAKIATIGKLIGKPVNRKPVTVAEKVGVHPQVPPLIAIGSSTGGPRVLADLLAALPAGLGASIVIVQHVDAEFAPGMAEWLNSRGALKVRVASAGCRPEPGLVWLAGTNDHLILKADLSLDYSPVPRDVPYRPSVDIFYRSLLTYWPRKDIAVLLTGMGRDGAEGLLALRSGGWHTVAQDEKSCVVYGMPRAAAELGAAAEISSPEGIASTLTRRFASLVFP